MKIYKFILSFVFCSTLLLLSSSFAYPDFYFYNNYLTGQSPYMVADGDFSSYAETGLWESYVPEISPTDSRADYSGIVTSFSDIHMSGSTPATAVPSLDIDLIAGHSVNIPSGHALVVYSGSGQGTNISLSNSIISFYLGTTSASVYRDTLNGQISTQVRSSSDGTYLEMPYAFYPNYSSTAGGMWGGTYYLPYANTNLLNLSKDTNGDDVEFSPYSISNVYLLYNNTSSTVRLYHQDWIGSVLSQDTIEFDDIKWILTTSRTVSNSTNMRTPEDYNYVTILPHIKGTLDIYSSVWETAYSANYQFSSYYNYSLDFDFSSITDTYGFVPFSLSSASQLIYHRFSVSTNDLSISANIDKIPIFLSPLNAQRSQSGQAIFINGGYIAITNYEELVDLLKDSGFTGDLARVIALLEEINTGGDKGEQVKELMTILEQYHQRIQNNANFSGSTGVFDTYKNILEFTSDMHWLVTANNALFEYFAGFIMLCCFFLFLSRVMR